VGTAFWRLTEGWLPGIPDSPAPFVIVGMMALFGSIAHAPLAVMLMVAEMTGNLSLLAPAMIALGVATVVVGDESIYTAQLGTRADSPAHRYRFSFPLLGSLPVRAATIPPPAIVRADVTVAVATREVLAEPPAGGLRGVPVLDGDGHFRGVVTPSALASVPPEAQARTTLAHLLGDDPPATAPHDTLDEALQQMAEREVSWLPVVEPGSGRLLGVVTVASALQHYRAVVRRGVRRIGSLVEGTSLVEVRIEPGTPLAWQPIAAAGFPSGAMVMAVRRHGEAIVPRGDTTLRPGDVLTVVVTPPAESHLSSWLARHARREPLAPDGVATAAGAAIDADAESTPVAPATAAVSPPRAERSGPVSRGPGSAPSSTR
jgi:CIC family chloride channel protein